MSFAVKSLYPSESQEAIITALLTVVALKSFEYIMKALLVSGAPSASLQASTRFPSPWTRRGIRLIMLPGCAVHLTSK